MQYLHAISSNIRRLALLLQLCLCLSFLPPALSQGTELEGRFAENQVKAVSLLHMTKFVTWPVNVGGSSSAEFTIAILGEDPLGSNLDLTVRGEYVGGRRIRVRRLKSPSQLHQGSVDLLFFGDGLDGKVGEIVDMAHQRGILTVGHQQGFCAAGGIVNLLAQDKRIRIEINVEEARAHNFGISAQVLRLARLVPTRRGSADE